MGNEGRGEIINRETSFSSTYKIPLRPESMSMEHLMTDPLSSTETEYIILRCLRYRQSAAFGRCCTREQLEACV